MRVAAVQFKADRKDRQGSRDRLLALCAQAAERGATLVVCPEMALTGYLFTDAADVARVAEPAQGESFCGAVFAGGALRPYAGLRLSGTSRGGTDAMLLQLGVDHWARRDAPFQLPQAAALHRRRNLGKAG